MVLYRSVSRSTGSPTAGSRYKGHCNIQRRRSPLKELQELQINYYYYTYNEICNAIGN